MSHISYSAFKIWNECPHKHKLSYIDRIRGFEGNEYTAFGTALHAVCENALVDEDLDTEAYFQEQFLQEIKALPEDILQESLFSLNLLDYKNYRFLFFFHSCAVFCIIKLTHAKWSLTCASIFRVKILFYIMKGFI